MKVVIDEHCILDDVVVIVNRGAHIQDDEIREAFGEDVKIIHSDTGEEISVIL